MMNSRKALLPLYAGVILAGAISLGGCGSSGADGAGDTPAISGSWKGTLNGSGSVTFQGYVDINTLRKGSVSGTVYFPGIAGSGACSGVLVYEGTSGSDYLFDEDLVARANPQCIKVGKVRISSADDGKAIKYSWSSGKNTAAGILKQAG